MSDKRQYEEDDRITNRTPEEIFSKCEAILASRKSSYEPDDNDEGRNTAEIASDLWTTYTGKVLFSTDVYIMMAMFKLARESIHHDEDNIIDAINYLTLYLANYGDD